MLTIFFILLALIIICFIIGILSQKIWKNEKLENSMIILCLVLLISFVIVLYDLT